MKHEGISLLGGALLGVAAMYLLDPEVGYKRRRWIASGASDALHGAEDLVSGAGDYLGDAWSQARKMGSRIARNTPDVSDITQSARGAMSAASSRASGIMSDASSSARDAQDQAADWGHSLRRSTHGVRHRLAHFIDPDHDHAVSHAVAYSTLSVSTLALGAAAMYFFDPNQGQSRREFVGQKLNEYIQETGHVCQLAGDYVARLWRGNQTSEHGEPQWRSQGQSEERESSPESSSSESSSGEKDHLSDQPSSSNPQMAAQ